MASIGHVAVGMAAARVYRDGRVPGWSAAAFWSAISLLPDSDVIGFRFGVEYGDPWGHRGATHSLTFALALAATLGLAASRFRWPGRRVWLIASVVLVSHGLLDTLTDGGLGAALFWPFDLTRYFAPWRPIPVAPIGLDYFSPYGAIVAFTELLLFSPLMFFALRSRTATVKPVAAGFLVALWVMALWLIASTDPLREAIVGVVLREDTAYAGGFSEGAFRTIAPGQSDREVRDLLGEPFGESWFYAVKGERAMDTAAAAVAGCRGVRFETGRVVTALDVDACRSIGVEAGVSLVEVERQIGLPRESCWQYSWSPRDTHYRMRMICFLDSRVDLVIRRWN